MNSAALSGRLLLRQALDAPNAEQLIRDPLGRFRAEDAPAASDSCTEGASGLASAGGAGAWPARSGADSRRRRRAPTTWLAQ